MRSKEEGRSSNCRWISEGVNAWRAFRVAGGVILICSMAFAFTPTYVAGAIINAKSSTRADVLSAITLASNGDTIVLPAGVATDWLNIVTINKAITLQGAGVGRTIIRDNVASGMLMKWTLVPGSPSRMTGIEFRGGTNGATWPNRIAVDGLNTNNCTMRIDNCKFDSLNGPLFELNTVIGVVDHNIIVASPKGVPAFVGHVKANSWGGTLGANRWGDGTWAEGDQFGSDRFLFFEDNYITNLYGPSSLTGLDCTMGARYVFRRNVMHKGSLEAHGAEGARDRGVRAIEIYQNIFVGDNSRSGIAYMRGGVGLIWSNSISGWTADANFALLDNRSIEHLCAPFNGADGRNPWDKNNPANPFDTASASSAGRLSVTDSTKRWTVNQWTGYTIRRTSGKTITSLSRVGNVCTAACLSHGFAAGDLVTIFGANQYAYNGIFTVTVVDANTFTFRTEWLAPTPATGAIRCCRGNNFALINSNTATQILFEGSVYNSTRDLSFAAGDTFEINKVDQSFDQVGVSGGSDLGGVDTPNIPVGWNNQTVSAWYEWGNTREGGADVDFGTGRVGGTYPVIVSGVHFRNDTLKPNYIPFVYPHPLVNTNASTMSKPTGLNIIAVE
jgi:hypothetical protein